MPNSSTLILQRSPGSWRQAAHGSIVPERLPQPLVLAALEFDELRDRAAAGRLNRPARPLDGASSPLLHRSLRGGVGGGFRSGFDSRIRSGGRRGGLGMENRRKKRGNNEREQGGKAGHEYF
jgi:hypothetical protein